MAEDSFQERTEQATPRRREKAREEGQVARSLELNSAVMVLLGCVTLLALGPYIVSQTSEMIKFTMINAATIGMGTPNFTTLYGSNLLKFLMIVGPIMLVMMVIGFFTNVAQVGFKVSTKALEPKFEKLDVVKGLSRLFTMKTLVSAIRDTLKLVIIGIVAYKVIKGEADNFFMLPDMNIAQLGAVIGKLTMMIAIKIGAAILLIAILDYAYQRWEFEKQIRMSHQEVKEEFKDTEGSPQIKGRIRQIQREMARRRMMQDVPKADVVITNPTHYAVAIKYDQEHMHAPYVIAKGERLIAQKIKQIAIEHHVPIIEDKQLAQALYKLCDVGQMIPYNLYRAVAEVLAYVFRLKGKVMS